EFGSDNGIRDQSGPRPGAAARALPAADTGEGTLRLGLCVGACDRATDWRRPGGAAGEVGQADLRVGSKCKRSVAVGAGFHNAEADAAMRFRFQFRAVLVELLHRPVPFPFADFQVAQNQEVLQLLDFREAEAVRVVDGSG